ncbi:SPFH domain-containing protein [Parabacteroides distasonis]|uniref:SPFH domain-containing protein n=1 Tax=Parabacteroides distasonis TaxID=823 RepID=UPI002805F6F8|nr:SPFH domain-containing protein [Parabacteroides distasonis]WMI43593.1 SPFH domain-containing protein [Parabacteroides distasonis]
MQKTKIYGVIVCVVAFLALMMLPKCAEDVKNEEIVINQVPFTGELEYWTTPGFKFQKGGRTSNYYKTNQIWFNEIEKEKKNNGNIILRPTGDNPALPITYNDKGKGYVLGSVRIELPTDQKFLYRIQTHYGSMDRLINDLIKPTLGKVILACGPLMTSLESVSEKRTDLIAYATDQLNYGVYKTMVKEEETTDQLTNEIKIIRIASLITDSVSPNGYKRQEESPFAYYGLKVSQLSISDMEYEQATIDQINKQREADMSIVTAKSKALEAAQLRIQAEEEGKRDAEKAKWKQEEIKAVEVTKAQQAYEVAQLQAKEAAEKAKKIIEEGKAEAEANRLKVQAGLTPQEKAEWDYKTTVGVAEALSKSNVRWVPEIMMGNTGGGNSMDAVGLKMMLDIANQMKK